MQPDYLHLTLNDQQLLQMSSLALAHVGDAVYELLTRCHLADAGDRTNARLHRDTVRLVRATAQAQAARRLAPHLQEDEAAVFRRGRNSKPKTVSRASSREEYALATGLEALFGWLYLKGRYDRINQLYALTLEPQA